MMWNDKGICTYPRCSCKATGVYCDRRKSGSDKRKRTSIPKRSKKGQLRAEEKKTLITSDMVLYLEIWEERPHRCTECSIPLGEKPLMQFFHHVLAKGHPRYGHLRHDKDNITLLCWSCHDKVTASLQALPKIYQLYLQLLKQHGYDNT